MLNEKKILIGVCGSIAAYKTAYLIRLLKKQHADVRVIMTSSASGFITPLTLSTLSKNPVLTRFTANDQGEWNNHVELGLWADIFVIAPASANTLAKMANGICDNLLLAVYLSARCPVYVAPAMDLDMHKHASTQANMRKLQESGVKMIDAEYGELASGLTGTGRMAEPENIVSIINDFFSSGRPLQGKKALVTAGPTYEKIDPIRFIGNHSSGKMGVAIARQLMAYGAEVKLILGPVNDFFDLESISVSNVISADEMYELAKEQFTGADITVLAAAVADYKPRIFADSKIKKNKDNLTLELTKTPDIAASLGKKKSDGQIIVGFALETDNEFENARKKLYSKNFNMIVLNSLNDPGAGFGHDTNKISILDKDNNTREYELKSKTGVAKDIVDAIVENYF
ncbi:MAG: bifunctional phosphopantothenoylcysteine decarboxylase/phosphopantothenate--cysteine ligase CoaBC [Bacteroidetes bacterium]|nr:bifunctional phosphopantothenoylcysteine decarboxylase/phosphopantothenate--cysteine ligase CoaBC [Bacteroidota bacterium]